MNHDGVQVFVRQKADSCRLASTILSDQFLAWLAYHNIDEEDIDWYPGPSFPPASIRFEKSEDAVTFRLTYPFTFVGSDGA